MEHEIKGDTEKEKGELWLDFRQGFNASVSETMGWKQLPDLSNTLLGMTKVVRRADRKEAYISEFNPVQQNTLGILSKYNMLSTPGGTKVPCPLGQ